MAILGAPSPWSRKNRNSGGVDAALTSDLSFSIILPYMPAKNVERVEGLVEENLPATTFRVKLPTGEVVLAHLAGKLRLHYIKVLPGDRVLMELSPDRARGRIVRRL